MDVVGLYGGGACGGVSALPRLQANVTGSCLSQCLVLKMSPGLASESTGFLGYGRNHCCRIMSAGSGSRLCLRVFCW